MAGKDSTWTVVYGDPQSPLSQSFERLKHTASFTNTIGIAEHYFSMSNNTPSGLGLNVLPAEIEGSPTLEFEIKEVGGEGSQKWKHMIYDYRILSSRRKGWRMRVRTVDMKASYNLEEKNKAHRVKEFAGSPGAGIVEEIVGQGELSPDGELWEACPVIPEYEILRQVNLTDYQFLTRHVMPRMKGGYYLYTNDGKKMQFHTAGYNAEKVDFESFQIHDVIEENRVFESVKMGGSVFQVTGYDPMLKKFLGVTEVGPDVNPSFGGTGPMHEGNRLEATFLQQDQSLDWWAETRNKWHAFRRYSLQVVFRGFIPDQKWVGSMEIDLSGTEFRQPDSQRGFVCGVVHEIEAGKYEVTAICNRDKID